MFRQLLSYDYTNYGIKPLRIIILLQIYRFIQYHHIIHYFIANSWKNKTSNLKKCGLFVDIIRGCICLLTRTFFSFKMKPICFMAHEHFLRTCLFVWNWRAYIPTSSLNRCNCMACFWNVEDNQTNKDVFRNS